MTTEPTTVDTAADEAFDQHCIVELMGHRKAAGRVREVQLAGAGFLRLDIPATDGHSAQTQYLSPGSVYALHPTTEEIAAAVAARFRPEPVQRWELPAAAVVVVGKSCTCESDHPGEDDDCPVHGDDADDPDAVEGGPF